MIQLEDVAIITVTFNSSSQLSTFLSNAVECVVSSNQIYVIDNDSSDFALSEDICNIYDVNFIKLKQNVGYGTAINRVITRLPDSVNCLVISNPDCLLNIESVRSLSKYCRQESIGVVGPKILNLDGSVYPSARAIPTLFNGVGHAFFSKMWPRNIWTKQYLSDSVSQKSIVETGWVSGACFAIRKDVFIQLDGFDERYFMYFEDVDLGYRLGKLGLKNLYVPEVSITHIGGESTKAIKKTMLRIHHESAMHFIRVKYKGILWAPMRGVIRIGLALRFWLQARKATT